MVNNEGALNGCTFSREAEKGDGGILGIERVCLAAPFACATGCWNDALGVV